MRAALIVAAALLAAACASREPIPGVDAQPRAERTLYQALKEAKATDPQRVDVENAFDRFDGKLKTLQSQSRELTAQWRSLDRRAPDFMERVRGLSERWSALAAERLITESAFEQQVAQILDESQWKTWQQFMRAEDESGRPYEYPRGRAPRR